MQVKIHSVICFLALAILPLLKAVPIIVSSDTGFLRFDTAQLSREAKAYYEKQGAVFSCDRCVGIVVVLDQKEDSGGVVAGEFKQSNEYSIWVWFNKKGQVVHRSSSVIIEGIIIPGSPTLAN